MLVGTGGRSQRLQENNYGCGGHEPGCRTKVDPAVIGRNDHYLVVYWRL